MPVTRHLLITLLQIQECVRLFGSHICGYASGPRSAVGLGEAMSSSDPQMDSSFLLRYPNFGVIRILNVCEYVSLPIIKTCGSLGAVALLMT
ncbi:hypothetical protein BST63_12035 [Bradyrhizobium canariense]|uniref:Uncharacterized protein n=1 Tax=Bradyrhizobium canariense TaxID=255045 RepID=A0ABX3X5D3_9BRAD|nr:hypothetical protein BSR47_09870 [Bradyrhizobium canariense]OSJ30508.1 hypothetical protein BST63_12035 [Bradyrhizobium canariense]